MKWYKCFIKGVNFPGVLIQEQGLIGFYLTRYVEANSVKLAETLVLRNLKENTHLKLPEGVPLPINSKLYFEYIEEVEKKSVPDIEPGFAFYVME